MQSEIRNDFLLNNEMKDCYKCRLCIKCLCSAKEILAKI